MKKRCQICDVRTEQWEIRGGITRCWECVRVFVNGGAPEPEDWWRKMLLREAKA